MTGTHVVEECPELDQWRPRRAVWKDWREALGGRAVSKKKEEEEGDVLGAFFYRVYEFLFSFSNPPPVVHRPHLPERYAIRFVPATTAPVSPPSPVPAASVSFPLSVVLSSSSSVSSSDYSVVSSANFAVPSSGFSVVSSANFVFPTSCIESNP